LTLFFENIPSKFAYVVTKATTPFSKISNGKILSYDSKEQFKECYYRIGLSSVYTVICLCSNQQTIGL
jgi:hypothetical protein